MTKAYEVGGHSAQCALITPIFRAYYEDDLDICDPEVLADAAEQAAVMSRADVSVPHCGMVAVPKDPPFYFLWRDPAFHVDLERFRSLS